MKNRKNRLCFSFDNIEYIYVIKKNQLCFIFVNKANISLITYENENRKSIDSGFC